MKAKCDFAWEIQTGADAKKISATKKAFRDRVAQDDTFARARARKLRAALGSRKLACVEPFMAPKVISDDGKVKLDTGSQLR